MAGSIRNLKNPFTGKFIFPVTKTRAVYNNDGSRLDNYLGSIKCTNNLLVNSNFINPVNQRGVTQDTWADGSYGLDRWIRSNIDIASMSPLSIKSTDKTADYGIEQRIPKNELITGSTMTFSAKVDDKIIVLTFTVGTKSYHKSDTDVKLMFSVHDGFYSVHIMPENTDKYITIEWVKLEYGEVATPYGARLYAEELQLCKKYFQIRSVNSIQVVDLEPSMRISPIIKSFGSNYSYDAEL